MSNVNAGSRAALEQGFNEPPACARPPGALLATIRKKEDDLTKPAFHHANLKTGRLDEMVAWYEAVAGLTVVFKWPGGAFLTNDGANHRLAFITSPALSDDPAKLSHTGIHHVAFEFPSLDDLLDTYVRLRDLGIKPHFTVDHGMTTSYYYLDPDGNSVELQIDNFGDWSRSTEFMRYAPEFAADPIGTLVDADRMVRDRAAGATPAEIHNRGYAGQYAP